MLPSTNLTMYHHANQNLQLTSQISVIGEMENTFVAAFPQILNLSPKRYDTGWISPNRRPIISSRMPIERNMEADGMVASANLVDEVDLDGVVQITSEYERTDQRVGSEKRCVGSVEGDERGFEGLTVVVEGG